MSEVENPANPAYYRVAGESPELPYECGYCEKRTACPVKKDWGGFCNVCGVSLPDEEGSEVLDELQRVAEAAKGIEREKLIKLGIGLVIYMGLFGLMTVILLTNQGPMLFGDKQPITLANIIWVAVGGALFTGLAFCYAGIEPPE